MAQKIIKDDKKYERIFGWARDKLNDIVGKYDGNKVYYTIIDLHVVVRTLLRLTDIPEEVPSLIDYGKEKITNYLKRCLTIHKGYQVPTLVPETSTPFLAAFRFFISIIKNCHLEFPGFSTIQESTKINVNKCKYPDIGGYGGIGSNEPDLVHTFHGMRLLKNIDSDH